MTERFADYPFFWSTMSVRFPTRTGQISKYSGRCFPGFPDYCDYERRCKDGSGIWNVLAPPQCSNRESKMPHEPLGEAQDRWFVRNNLSLLVSWPSDSSKQSVVIYRMSAWKPRGGTHVEFNILQCDKASVEYRVSLSLEQGVSGEPPVVDCRASYTKVRTR
jgi:hypothetical protein